jgi:hypothetical protein
VVNPAAGWGGQPPEYSRRELETEMQHPELEIVISKAGKVTLTVSGARGPRCLEYADLVKELVGREEERQLTAEYYAPPGEVRVDAQVHGRHTP